MYFVHNGDFLNSYPQINIWLCRCDFWNF